MKPRRFLGPVFHPTATIRERYGPAMDLETQEEADAYFEKLVELGLHRGKSDRKEMERIERDNLAYFAGYYTHETRLRVEKLFRCVHPVHGKA